MSEHTPPHLEAFGLRFFASSIVPPGSAIVIHPDTMARTLSLDALLRHPCGPDVVDPPAPPPPTVAELLAGFDAKIEAAIARVARRHREEDLRRIAVAEGWGNGR